VHRQGESHRRYEFGCKVAVVSSSQNNWVIGIGAEHGNPYDGHTLAGSLDQAKGITGWQPGIAYCDRTYQGQGEEVNGTKIRITGKRKKA
jgi:transposase, IS5 family